MRSVQKQKACTKLCVRKFPFTVLTIAFFLFFSFPPITQKNQQQQNKKPKHHRKDLECNSDNDCPNEKSCINLHCINPCNLRGACGENALCRAILHKPRCSCPQCYVGNPHHICRIDPKCDSTQETEVRAITCTTNNDCPTSLACNYISQECYNPCKTPSFKCRGNKKCHVNNHRPICVCKSSFVLNENGELMCAPSNFECTKDDDCPSNKACLKGICVSPCNERSCAKGKSCEVLNHKAVCVCLRDCVPSLSICLRDSGCAAHQACRNFKCEDPCATAQCSEAPCYVEDHRPICKFCPTGFVSDSKYGCLKGKLSGFFDKKKSIK